MRFPLLAGCLLSLSLTVTSTSHAEFEFDTQRASVAGLKALQTLTLSEKQVKKTASQAAGQLDGQHQIAPPDHPYAQRLAALTHGMGDATGLRLDFKVYMKPDINAFAMADGTVRVFSGLMDAMPDDQVLAVIGHEIGHVELKHSFKQMRKAMMADTALAAVATMGGKAAELSEGKLGALAQNALNAKFSRTDELGADEYAVKILHRMGRDPLAMKRAIETLRARYGNGGGFMSSHPANDDRIKAIDQAIAKLGR